MTCNRCNNTGKKGNYVWENNHWEHEDYCDCCDEGDRAKERDEEKIKRDFYISSLGD